MKRVLTSVVLAASLALLPACAVTKGLGSLLNPTPQTQIQVTNLAADAIDGANKLGEVVLQLQEKSHRLYCPSSTAPCSTQTHTIPLETEVAVQNAAIQFANGKDAAVAGINKATTALQVAAAAAPLVGSANTIITSLKGVSGLTLPGTAGLLTAQLPDLLKQAKTFIGQLGGK